MDQAGLWFSKCSIVLNHVDTISYTYSTKWLGMLLWAYKWPEDKWKSSEMKERSNDKSSKGERSKDKSSKGKNSKSMSSKGKIYIQ